MNFLQAVNILVAYKYKQRDKLSIIYYTCIVLIQYSKPLISIFKALVYTKTVNNDTHGYTSLDIHICKLSEFLFAFVFFFHGIFS